MLPGRTVVSRPHERVALHPCIAGAGDDEGVGIRLVRERTRILVALGDCAITTNVTGLRNPIPLKSIFDRVYVEGSDVQKVHPTEGLPVLLKHAIPLHDVVKVDLHVPGCPPKPNAILFALSELLEGRKPDLGSKLRFG